MMALSRGAGRLPSNYCLRLGPHEVHHRCVLRLFEVKRSLDRALIMPQSSITPQPMRPTPAPPSFLRSTIKSANQLLKEQPHHLQLSPTDLLVPRRPPGLRSSMPVYLDAAVFFRFFVGNGSRWGMGRSPPSLQLLKWLYSSRVEAIMRHCQHDLRCTLRF